MPLMKRERHVFFYKKIIKGRNFISRGKQIGTPQTCQVKMLEVFNGFIGEKLGRHGSGSRSVIDVVYDRFFHGNHFHGDIVYVA